MLLVPDSGVAMKKVTDLRNLCSLLMLGADSVHLYRDFFSLSLDVKKCIPLGSFCLVCLAEADHEAVVIVKGFGLECLESLLDTWADNYGGVNRTHHLKEPCIQLISKHLNRFAFPPPFGLLLLTWLVVGILL